MATVLADAERLSQRTQLSRCQSPGPHKLWNNYVCCFKMLNLEVVCYTATAVWNTHHRDWVCLLWAAKGHQVCLSKGWPPHTPFSLHVLSNLTLTVLPDHRSEDWEQPWSEGADSKVAMLWERKQGSSLIFSIYPWPLHLLSGPFQILYCSQWGPYHHLCWEPNLLARHQEG